jgi:hypothetical protein
MNKLIRIKFNMQAMLIKAKSTVKNVLIYYYLIHSTLDESEELRLC